MALRGKFLWIVPPSLTDELETKLRSIVHQQGISGSRYADNMNL
jgi:hypothetical protein